MSPIGRRRPRTNSQAKMSTWAWPTALLPPCLHRISPSPSQGPGRKRASPCSWTLIRAPSLILASLGPIILCEGSSPALVGLVTRPRRQPRSTLLARTGLLRDGTDRQARWKAPPWRGARCSTFILYPRPIQTTSTLAGLPSKAQVPVPTRSRSRRQSPSHPSLRGSMRQVGIGRPSLAGAMIANGSLMAPLS